MEFCIEGILGVVVEGGILGIRVFFLSFVFFVIFFRFVR